MLTFRISLFKVRGELIFGITCSVYIGREGEKVRGREFTLGVGPAFPPWVIKWEKREDLR